MLRNSSVAISVSPHVCFISVLILISMQGRTTDEGRSTANKLKPPPPSLSLCNFIAGHHKVALLFWFFMVVLLPFSLFAGDVFNGVFLCCPFSKEVSWMRSGT